MIADPVVADPEADEIVKEGAASGIDTTKLFQVEPFAPNPVALELTFAVAPAGTRRNTY